MAEFELRSEPRGEDYDALLDAAVKSCARVSLIMRPEPVDLEANHVLSRLQSWAVEAKEVQSWPGTEILLDTAIQHTFALQPETAEVLKTASRGLYDWQHPALPEDPCFYREDGSVWLATIAHEGDATLYLNCG